MDGLLSRVGHMTSPRSLLALSLMLSVLSAGGGRGTLAYFTSTAVSSSLTFSSGIVDLNANSTTAVSATALTWDSNAGGTNCTTLALETGANDTTAQRMVPGQFCVAPLTIGNTATNAVDAWMRIRLVRDTTATDTTTTALNDRLRFYMSEYAGTGDRSGAQTSDCTPTSFRPTPALSANLYTTADTAGAVTIADTTATAKSTSIIADANVTTNVNRSAVRALGEIGKNIGQHPGMFAPGDTTAGSYFDTAAGTVFNPATSTVIPEVAAKGLGLVGGANGGVTEASFVTGADSTVGTGRNAFNLVGNDEATNPRKIGTPTLANGSRAYSTNTEAELTAGTTRYYCAGIFFPSDTGVGGTASASTYGSTTLQSSVTAVNSFGDNLAASTSNAYRVVVTAAQKAGRSVN
jgi:hypothetical protein